MSKKTEIPEGWMENAQGHLVREEHVDDYDKARDALVRELVSEAHRVHDVLADFKVKAMGDVDAFVELSGERYDVSIGGAKGNVQLTSFDGRYQVKVQVADRIKFDERIHAAKAIFDECIRAWSDDADSKVKTLLEHAFQTDKEGTINTSRVLALTRLKIDDERWQQGVQAIKDSTMVASSSSYLRIYERNKDGKYEKLNLDIATI